MHPIASNPHAIAHPAEHPVSRGHTVITPHRAIASWTDATRDEQLALLDLIEHVKRALDALSPAPDGYRIHFDVGVAVTHLHVHVIPRYPGETRTPLATGGSRDPFARHIVPLFVRADEIAIVAAFVQESGIDRLAPSIRDALARGTRIRILTGDYLEITQASALEQLLDWQSTTTDDGGGDDDAPDSPSLLETRVIEVDRLPSPVRSFHPKSWRFENATHGIAFVGSSNLSRAALDSGIEWNLRVDRTHDPVAYERIVEAFEDLWKQARVLDAAWIAAYAERARRAQHAFPAPEIEPEPPREPPSPHDVQIEALARLRDARAQGRRRALVVLATGLGKTWLAAFDYWQLREELGRPPRLLFLAHRRELLRQAARSYRDLVASRGDRARVGWFVEEHGDLTAPIVFASVAKLSRAQHLERLAEERFDYVVVDEVHHAHADSYRRILGRLDPTFLLGLTATPDRADAADILGLFDDFIAYRADIAKGIEVGRLVPFHYFGVKDEIEYANLPWRNRRFDPEELSRAVQTEARMTTLWRAWNAHPGGRTLIFCCSIAHADFTREWLRARGVRVSAVYAAPGSDDRDASLAALASGEIDALCAVDVFNEGVDVPAIDRVVMLRPTESSVIFLQQLGRGLRAHPGKRHVSVIDFVGNHRVFLDRLRTLLSLAAGGRIPNLRKALETDETIELPEGCSVDLELDAKTLLMNALGSTPGVDEIERVYRELRDARGIELRPTAGELQRMGYVLSRLRARHGGWFQFVRGEGDLSTEQIAVLDIAGAFFADIETADMTKSLEMVTLEALLDAGAFFTGRSLGELAAKSFAILKRTPELSEDILESERVPELTATNAPRWNAYWRKNPIEAWTATRAKGRTWFRLVGTGAEAQFTFDLRIEPALHDTFAAMLAELVDYRLAQYRARRRFGDVTAEGFACRVLSNQRDPILKIPRREGTALPEGEIDVRLPEGSVWVFKFAKEFVNVAKPAGAATNQLPDLLRRWFGPKAGQPGTAFQVRFRAGAEGLWVEPERANDVVPLRGVVAYPDLAAAAGHARGEVESTESERVFLPVASNDPDLFAVRVAGDSMDGGRSPLRDGDWAVLRHARGAALASIEDRVVLVQIPGEASGSRFQIKRLKRSGSEWLLTSDNPEGPTFAANADTVPIARLERGVHPEDLAPPVGTTLAVEAVGEAFGIESLRAVSSRQGGHLFVFVDAKGALLAPGRVKHGGPRRRPGETAYVLAKVGEDAWRYCGVGRWIEDDGAWRIPEVDAATWRKYGDGTIPVSKPLPEGVLARAQRVVDAVSAWREGDRRLQLANGIAARVLGANSGEVRVSAGEGDASERTIPLTDLAWVIAADDDVRQRGGVLDASRVHRVRHGNEPTTAQRENDAAWAIALWQLARSRGVDAMDRVHRMRRADRTEVDAAFRIESVGGAVTVVLESRGGTRGTPGAQNADYAEGLELILRRLKDAGVAIADARVESRDTQKLGDDARRLVLSRPYPIAIEDPLALRREMSAAQARVGRAPGAKGGGNQNKRIRITLQAPASELGRIAESLIGREAARSANPLA